MLKSRISKVAKALDNEILPALRLAAERVEDDARSRVPVDSGALRDSIRSEKRDDGYAVVAGDGDAFYARMVEMGTTKHPARPYLVPAVEAVRGELDTLIRSALRDL